MAGILRHSGQSRYWHSAKIENETGRRGGNPVGCRELARCGRLAPWVLDGRMVVDVIGIGWKRTCIGAPHVRLRQQACLQLLAVAAPIEREKELDVQPLGALGALT